MFYNVQYRNTYDNEQFHHRTWKPSIQIIILNVADKSVQFNQGLIEMHNINNLNPESYYEKNSLHF